MEKNSLSFFRHRCCYLYKLSNHKLHSSLRFAIFLSFFYIYRYICAIFPFFWLIIYTKDFNYTIIYTIIFIPLYVIFTIDLFEYRFES